MIGQEPGVPHGPGDIGLTLDEARTHFGIWCMMASPLWITYDILSGAKPAIHAIVTNPEAIAIDQDSAGQMAVRIDGASTSPSGLNHRLPGTCGVEAIWPNGEHLARPLANGDTAVLVFNRLAANLTITLNFEDIGDTTVTCFHVRDIWARADLGLHSGRFVAADVPPHGSRFLRLAPANHSLCDGDLPRNTTAPAGFTAAGRGVWQNYSASTKDASRTVEGCAEVCEAAGSACLGFHVFDPCQPNGSCHVYFGGLTAFAPHEHAFAFRRAT
jgi:hypothetical protein